LSFRDLESAGTFLTNLMIWQMLSGYSEASLTLSQPQKEPLSNLHSRLSRTIYPVGRPTTEPSLPSTISALLSPDDPDALFGKTSPTDLSPAGVGGGGG